MPPLPAAGAVIRVQLKATQAEDLDVLSRFYLGYSGPAPTDAQLNTFCTAVGTAWNSDLAAIHATNVTLVEVLAEDLSTLSAAVGLAVVAHAGTDASGALPSGAATLINFAIARRYRGGKPRIYLPAGASDKLYDGQKWQAAFVTAVNTAWAAFITACQAAPWSGATVTGQVNVSYYAGFASAQNPVTKRWRNYNLPRVTPVVDSVVSIATSARIASQRRRYGGR